MFQLYSHCLYLEFRFTGEHHRFLLDFLKSVANRYRQDSRAAEFILDLLLLEVPKLFTIEGSQEAETATVISLEFTSFLRDFINRYALKHTILGQMGNILVGWTVYYELVM